MIDKQIIKKVLREVRGAMIDYLREQLPKWPDYVIKDFAYATLKNGSVPQIQEFIEEYGDVQWNLVENMPITLDIFDESTQQHFQKREMGKSNPYQVPRDTERHEFQRNRILNGGLPTEPIIMFKNPNGQYELVEGWHRTIQLLTLFPEGFKYPKVWVGLIQN